MKRRPKPLQTSCSSVRCEFPLLIKKIKQLGKKAHFFQIRGPEKQSTGRGQGGQTTCTARSVHFFPFGEIIYVCKEPDDNTLLYLGMETKFVVDCSLAGSKREVLTFEGSSNLPGTYVHTAGAVKTETSKKIRQKKRLVFFS